MKSLLLICLFVFSGSAFELTRSVDRTSVQLGEPMKLTLVATHKPSERLVFPGPEHPFGDAELRDLRTEREEQGGQVVERRIYELQIFKLGKGTIPRLPVINSADTADKKFSDSIDIIVKAVAGPSDTADIQDIYGPQSLPLPKSFWIILFGSIALLVLVLFLFDRYIRKKKTVVAPPPPPIPPEVQFEKEIAQLRLDDLLRSGAVKEFHLRLSEILRRYLGSRFGFEALESTTTELFSMLRSKGVDGSIIRQLEAFAGMNDPVKFAKWIPSNDMSDGLIETARNIVAETTPAL